MCHNSTPVSTSVSTIITCLYDLNIQGRFDNLIKYKDYWLGLSFPVIIWTDDTCYDSISKFFNKSNFHIIKKNLCDFPSFELYNKINKLTTIYKINDKHPTYDTMLYYMLMYARPEMWRQSIIKNPFNAQTFICTDFAIARFNQNLKIIESWVIYPTLKLMIINPYLTSDPPPHKYFHTTWHNVAGGMITGSGENITQLVSLFYLELNQMIIDEWYQLDEAILACIVRKYSHIFDCYYGDYCGILTNYEKIVDLTNIPRIIQKYLENLQYFEAQRVLDSIDYSHSNETLKLYLNYSILTNYYTYNKRLKPIVYDYLQKPEYIAIRKSNASNLKWYKVIR